MCNLSGKYTYRNMKYLISCVSLATRNTTVILTEGERNPRKEKCMWRHRFKCFEFSTPPLSPQTADHMCSFFVCTYLFWIYIPLTFPFDSSRGKSPVLESVCEREVRIDRCAVIAELWKWLSGDNPRQWVVGEVGVGLGGRTHRQQDSHLSASTLWLWNCSNFDDIPVVCGVLGTQSLLKWALSSGDHPYGNRGLGYFIDYQETGEFREGNPCIFQFPNI